MTQLAHLIYFSSCCTHAHTQKSYLVIYHMTIFSCCCFLSFSHRVDIESAWSMPPHGTWKLRNFHSWISPELSKFHYIFAKSAIGRRNNFAVSHTLLFVDKAYYSENENCVASVCFCFFFFFVFMKKKYFDLSIIEKYILAALILSEHCFGNALSSSCICLGEAMYVSRYTVWCLSCCLWGLANNFFFKWLIYFFD